MGEPNSTEMDPVLTIALSALRLGGGVSASLLRQSGLHRDVLRGCFDIFKPEIKNLVGWKPLREFGYKPYWREVETEEVRRGHALTAKWHEELESRGLSDELSVLIYDGELLRPPAKDYRLFLLRDERLLYYAGGFHATYRRGPVCGDALTVLEALDAAYSHSRVAMFPSEEPFIVLMKSFSEALQRAIGERKLRIGEQETLNAQLEQLVSRVSNK